jgi:hypothetical protein
MAALHRQVRKINVCHRALPMRNLWYQFLPLSSAEHYHHHYGHHCGSHLSAQTLGRVPCINDVAGAGRTVRAYTQYAGDAGKTIRLFGIDSNGQELRTDDGGGVFSEGLKMTLTATYVDSTTEILRIDRVLKESTIGNVLLYAHVTATDLLELLAEYEPSETNPSYQRERLNLPCHSATTTLAADQYRILALVKVGFVPVSVDTDIVQIPNLEALKDMIQSLRWREAGDKANADGFEQSAIRELNLQLRDDSPDEQFAVSSRPMGRCSFTNQAF